MDGQIKAFQSRYVQMNIIKELSMKKILLVLSILFTASLANAAGDPVPGVGVSLEQIPGGVYHTQSDCIRRGGSIIHKNGRTYCNSHARKRVTVKEILKDGSDGVRYQ